MPATIDAIVLPPRVDHVLGAAGRIVAIALACTLLSCGAGGSGSGATPAPGLIPRSGQDVIDATRAAGSATFAVHDDDVTYDVAYDFTHDRARTRTQLPIEGTGTTIDVEARTIDGTSYVKDGSWLCPGCGLDDEDPPPLPKDKWIVVDASDDVAFGLGANAFHGQLAWLRLVDERVEPGPESRLADGTSVATYRTEIPVARANAAIDAAAPAGEGVPRLQGTSVTVTFTADTRGRLRELVVDYRVDDQDRTLTATLESYGTSITIEAPPAGDIYVEPDAT
jgi:hypothetical protein